MPGKARLMAMIGRDKFQRKLRRLSGADVVRAAGRVLFVGADLIKAEAQQSITRGAVSGKGHVASRPGEPPKNDTGVLKNNIETSMTGLLEAEVRANAPYAAPLEIGTSKMAARPYMRPARDKMAPKIHRLFAAEIEKLIDRV